MNKTITFRCQQTEKEWLESQAKREGTTVSKLIKRSINYYQTGRDEQLDRVAEELKKRLVMV